MRSFQTEPADHRFFSGMAIFVAALVVLGFSQTYPARGFAPGAGLPPVIHLHALAFFCWLLVFVAQTLLALKGRIDLHRRLGTIGVVLAALMLILGVAAALTAGRLGHRGVPGVEFPDAGGFLLLNLGAVAVFSILVGTAWRFRHRPQVHKRLMLTALVGGLAPPGLARLPFVAGRTPAIAGLAMALLLAGPVYDLATRRRLHPAYLFGLVVALASIPPVVEKLSASGPWHLVAAWLLR